MCLLAFIPWLPGHAATPMQSKYTLLDRIRADVAAGPEASVLVDIRDAPRVFATLTALRQDLGDEAAAVVPLRAHHAVCYGYLKRFAEAEDLSADDWATADIDQLAETADFLGADERFMRRFIEIAFNRLSLRRSFPAAFHAKTQESQDKLGLRKPKNAPPRPFASLVRVQLAEPAGPGPGPPPSTGPPDPDAATLMPAFEESMCVVPVMRQTLQLPPFVENVLRTYPETVLAGGGALHAVVENLNEGARLDADIFLWGVTPERANVVARGIVDGIVAASTQLIRASITGNAITIVSTGEGGGPNDVCVQIVLRLCQTPDEMLLGFDIPPSKVLVRWNQDTGQLEAWCTRSWLVAVRAGAFWLSPDDQSCNYVQRVWKYWLKGFRVLLTGLDRRRVNSAVYNAPSARALRGLARLLRIEHSLLNKDPGLVSKTWYSSFLLRRYVGRELYQLREPNSDYATETRSMSATLRYPMLSSTQTAFEWMVRDAGSQAPVSGSFNPSNSPFYKDVM